MQHRVGDTFNFSAEGPAGHSLFIGKVTRTYNEDGRRWMIVTTTEGHLFKMGVDGNDPELIARHR